MNAESPASPPANTASKFDARELLAALPHRPGVYRMFNAAGETLYVGKARDLKKRVSSYFQKSDHEPRIAAMLAHVARVETTVTHSEGKALLLENNFIKSHEPRYNILFRDDKSYPYVCLSGDEYPQLRFHRGALDRRNRYFGPFPGAGAVREGIALLQKVFLLRTCDNTVFANRSRPCMLYQIQRCTAPCVGLIAEEEYREDVHGATLFLQGRAGEVLTQMQAQMEAAAAALEFERAARFRDRIGRLQHLQSRQFVESATAGDIDVVAAAAEGGLIAVNVVMIRGGRHVGDRTIFPRHADALNSTADSEIVPAFLEQHYVEKPSNRRRSSCRRTCSYQAALGLAEVSLRAIGAQGGNCRQPRRRAPRLDDHGAAERDAGDPAAAGAEGHTGGPAGRIAGSARPAAHGAADRMFRCVAHDG